MAKSNDITLTKALYGITKTTAKISFVFFIIAAILVSITINAGNPNVNTYSLYNQDPNFLYEFKVANSNSEVQIGFFITSNENLVDYIEFKIQKVSSDGVDILEVVLSSRSHEFFRELSLDSGSYKVIATAYFEANRQTSVENVEIASGYGSFNLVLVGLSLLAIVIASISIGIFFAVLPFTVFVLILNSINNSSKPKYEQKRYQKQEPEVVTSPQIREQSRPIQSTIKTSKVSPFSFDPESFAAKFTTKDWAWLLIALISFIGFLFAPDSPFLFFAIIITIVIIYTVSEREKTKLRLLNLLNTYNQTSVDFLKLQLDKKTKYVIKVLQYMILDDAMPIMLDMGTLKVTVIGSLSPYLPQREYTSPKASYQDSPSHQEQSDQTVVASEESTIVQVVQPDESLVEMHCTACGEGLIGKPKYCYICGQKTI